MHICRELVTHIDSFLLVVCHSRTQSAINSWSFRQIILPSGRGSGHGSLRQSFRAIPTCFPFAHLICKTRVHGPPVLWPVPRSRKITNAISNRLLNFPADHSTIRKGGQKWHSAKQLYSNSHLFSSIRPVRWLEFTLPWSRNNAAFVNSKQLKRPA